MGIIMWLIVGGIVGWLAGLIMGDDMGLIGNIVIGIVGAFIGGLLFARGDINTAGLTVETFAVSILGAVILLAVVNLFRRGRLR
jgi:uncharacterized membrane protein YeaQ/YmgE (transglycosylase-associated protein family)